MRRTNGAKDWREMGAITMVAELRTQKKRTGRLNMSEDHIHLWETRELKSTVL